MSSVSSTQSSRDSLILSAAAVLILLSGLALAQADRDPLNVHTSTAFAGAKANTGTVMHHVDGGRELLTLSADFVVPQSPAPHWRLVDGRGQEFLLNRLVIKDDKLNGTIEVPAYLHDVAKVQIWCAFAEVVLGEAAFEPAITVNAGAGGDAACGVADAAGPVVKTVPLLTLEGARRICAAAVAQARKGAGTGAIAITDAGGNVLYLERLDNTFAAGSNVSIGKAKTAALFRKPTRAFEESINKGRTALVAVDFTPLQGGVPIEIDGVVVGGIGVSGAASQQQDEEIAIAGADAAKTFMGAAGVQGDVATPAVAGARG